MNLKLKGLNFQKIKVVRVKWEYLCLGKERKVSYLVGIIMENKITRPLKGNLKILVAKL